jgi:sec-independent protein translocase protein TatB
MSSGELLLTLSVALIVFGPSKLPMLATHLGQFIKMMNRIKTQLRRVWQQQMQELQLHENNQKAEEAERQYQQMREQKCLEANAD